MNPGKQITQFGAAIFFLLAILLQPVHQLEHLTHHHPHVEEGKTAFINFHETHCNLCDFNFTPTLELEIANLDVPLKFDFIEPKQEFSVSNYYHSELNLHQQLRAPPFYV